MNYWREADATYKQGLARQSAMLTHSHKDGYNGAILECLAIHQALFTDPGSLSREQFLDDLLTKMQIVEGSSATTRKQKDNMSEPVSEPDSPQDTADSEEGISYCWKLRKTRELLQSRSTTRRKVQNYLGIRISALHSVPTAIYCFLRCLEPLDDDLEGMVGESAFYRTILYAISLGGDTDTIACMAGYIAGAYHGMDQIPEWCIKQCEGAKDAIKYAEKLFKKYRT